VKGIHGLDPMKDKFETNLSAAGMALGEEREALLQQHVVSVRIQTVRNLSGIAYLSTATDTERAKVHELLSEAFGQLEDEVEGTFELLQDLDPDLEEELESDGRLLTRPLATSLAAASGAARHWPHHRL